jgi:hypothetical protein
VVQRCISLKYSAPTLLLTPYSQKVREEKPDVLVLLGPFVDVKHPLVEKCDVGEMTLGELFESQIRHVQQNIPSSTHVSSTSINKFIFCFK